MNWRVLGVEGDNAVVFMHITSDIDVTSKMTMFAIDIWGDRHASDLQFCIWCPLCTFLLSDLLLTVDCRAAW